MEKEVQKMAPKEAFCVYDDYELGFRNGNPSRDAGRLK